MRTSSKIKNAFKKFFFIEKWKENKNSRPSGKQLRSFFDIISSPERILLLSFVLILIISAIGWWRVDFLEKTKVVPKEGGNISEVISSVPQNLNPIFASLNDADRDVSELIYAGLLKYNEDGELESDLAKKYRSTSEGKVYIFTLKDNIYWSDGEKITADDVLFTMDTIQNPSTQSPLKVLFQGVKVRKVDQNSIKFVLDNPYPSFLENFTLKIIPRHTFQETDPRDLSSFIPEEIASSGPFKIEKILKNGEKIERISLEANEKYNDGVPYIKKFDLIFKETEEEALKLKSKTTNFGDLSPKDKNGMQKKYNVYSLYSPRYFALFLNQTRAPLNMKEVKGAMVLATPKDKITEEVFDGQARKAEGLFLPENNIRGKYKIYKYNLKAAKEKLKNSGWKDTNNDGAREKKINGQTMTLNFTIYTVEQSELESASRIIKESWEKIGIKIEVKTLQPQELLQTIIKSRRYEILLFGHSLMMKPEPYSFWHSSQVNYPGLNLSLYKNDDVDKMLEKAREERELSKRNKILSSVRKKIAEDIPAIFLYSPDYLYALKKNIKGFDGKYIIDPSKRFIDVQKWYIKTQRVPKYQIETKPPQPVIKKAK